MKRIVFFLVACSFSVLLSAQFRAKMTANMSGTEKHYTVYSDGQNYRYEFTEVGQPGVIIVKPSKNKTYVIMTQQKQYGVQPCDGMMSLMNDPVQASLHFADQKTVTEKITGTEKMTGYACVKKEYFLKYPDGQEVKTYDVWFSKKLNFPVKIVFEPKNRVFLELSDIQPWKPDPAYFKVPDGYTEMKQ